MLRKVETIPIPPDISNELHDAAMDAASETGALLRSEPAAHKAVDVARRIAELYPEEIREQITELRKCGNELGALAIRGFSIPSNMEIALPDALGNLPDLEAASASGLLALSTAILAGPPISYTTNPRGHLPTLITQITPMPEGDPNRHVLGFTSPVRSGGDTGWHAENGGATPHKRIQFLSLFCVRGQAGVPTLILPGHVVDESLTEEDRAIFRERKFMLPDRSIKNTYTEPRPIITDTPRGPAINYHDSYARETQDKDTRSALERLRINIGGAAARASMHEMQTGDVLFVDNNGLHRRSSFEPAWPHPRWHMRTYIGTEGAALFFDPSAPVES